MNIKIQSCLKYNQLIIEGLHKQIQDCQDIDIALAEYMIEAQRNLLICNLLLPDKIKGVKNEHKLG